VIATANDWATWLLPVASAVRNPPTPSDFQGRCAALAFALRVPTDALTEAKARDLCRKSEFWPSVADVETLFAEDWKAEARSRSITSGLTRIAPPSAAQPTPDQRQASAAAALRVAAELRTTQAAVKVEVEPRYLAPAALLAQYENLAAQGNQAAATRAARLRQALG
jgi:hypothetical protein